MQRWLTRLTRPHPLPHWSADLLILVPRLVCGYLLTTEFGAPKFGLPWSPPDNNLRLFEVAFWFPNDVRDIGGRCNDGAARGRQDRRRQCATSRDEAGVAGRAVATRARVTSREWPS